MSPEGLGYLWHVKIRSETNINSGKQNTYRCIHTCTYVGLRYEEKTTSENSSSLAFTKKDDVPTYFITTLVVWPFLVSEHR